MLTVNWMGNKTDWVIKGSSWEVITRLFASDMCQCYTTSGPVFPVHLFASPVNMTHWSLPRQSYHCQTYEVDGDPWDSHGTCLSIYGQTPAIRCPVELPEIERPESNFLGGLSPDLIRECPLKTTPSPRLSLETMSPLQGRGVLLGQHLCELRGLCNDTKSITKKEILASDAKNFLQESQQATLIESKSNEQMKHSNSVYHVNLYKPKSIKSHFLKLYLLFIANVQGFGQVRYNGRSHSEM